MIRLILPLVLQGVVTVQNFGPSDLRVTARFTDYSIEQTVLSHSEKDFTVYTDGFALIETNSPDIQAWTVIDGVTFKATRLEGHNRAFAASPDSGVAIANPWREDVTGTFWIYRAAYGTLVDYVQNTFRSGKTAVGFFREMIYPVEGDVVVQLVSRRPLGVVAAECMAGCIGIPVHAVGVN